MPYIHIPGTFAVVPPMLQRSQRSQILDMWDLPLGTALALVYLDYYATHEATAVWNFETTARVLGTHPIRVIPRLPYSLLKRLDLPALNELVLVSGPTAVADVLRELIPPAVVDRPYG